MMETITLREYDALRIRDCRDVSNKTISREDAETLERIIMNGEPVFSWGYKKLVAQHWVGSISLNGLNIEILPKLYGYVSDFDLREILTRMLIVANRHPSMKNLPGNTKTQKSSLIEMIIDTFLTELERYLKEGFCHSYKKYNQNIDRVKGQIIFNKQFSKNVLNPARFWCRYSIFTTDTDINRFLKLCVVEMSRVSTDPNNQRRLRYLLPPFEAIQVMNRAEAIAKSIIFNSTNHRAESAYLYGKLFLSNIFSTLSAGNLPINMMLFDMNDVYEKFIYRVAKMVFGNNVIYQLRGNYLLNRDSDSKKYIALRPDLTIKRADGTIDILDTKWKIPKSFAKESDTYQMNAYSTGIAGVNRTIILYPYVEKQKIVGDYSFIGSDKQLKLRTVDLCACLNWKKFLEEFRNCLL